MSSEVWALTGALDKLTLHMAGVACGGGATRGTVRGPPFVCLRLYAYGSCGPAIVLTLVFSAQDGVVPLSTVPHERVHQDTRQCCLVLCNQVDWAWCASVRKPDRNQRRPLHGSYGPEHRIFDSDCFTVDLEEGGWVDTGNILARCMGECARRFSFRVRGETSTIQIRQSGVCAITSVIWMMFTLIVSLFPYSKQTNPQEMNYIVVVLGGVLGFPLVWYYFPIYGGVHWFEGPVLNVDGYVARKWMTLRGSWRNPFCQQTRRRSARAPHRARPLEISLTTLNYDS